MSNSQDQSPVNNQMELKLDAGERQQPILIKSKKTTLGSHEQCDVVLNSSQVQPVHCLVIQGSAGTIIRNFHADTRLNGEAFGDQWFQAGDTISIGNINLQQVDNNKKTNPKVEASTAEEIESRSDQAVELVERLSSLEKEIGELREASFRFEQKAEGFEREVQEKLQDIDRLEQQNSDLMSRLEFTRQDREMIQEFENQAQALSNKTRLIEEALEKKDQIIGQFAEQNSTLASEVHQLRNTETEEQDAEFTPPIESSQETENESDFSSASFTDSNLDIGESTDNETSSADVDADCQDEFSNPEIHEDVDATGFDVTQFTSPNASIHSMDEVTNELVENEPSEDVEEETNSEAYFSTASEFFDSAPDFNLGSESDQNEMVADHGTKDRQIVEKETCPTESENFPASSSSESNDDPFQVLNLIDEARSSALADEPFNETTPSIDEVQNGTCDKADPVDPSDESENGLDSCSESEMDIESEIAKLHQLLDENREDLQQEQFDDSPKSNSESVENQIEDDSPSTFLDKEDDLQTSLDERIEDVPVSDQSTVADGVASEFDDREIDREFSSSEFDSQSELDSVDATATGSITDQTENTSTESGDELGTNSVRDLFEAIEEPANTTDGLEASGMDYLSELIDSDNPDSGIDSPTAETDESVESPSSDSEEDGTEFNFDLAESNFSGPFNELADEYTPAENNIVENDFNGDEVPEDLATDLSESANSESSLQSELEDEIVSSGEESSDDIDADGMFAAIRDAEEEENPYAMYENSDVMHESAADWNAPANEADPSDEIADEGHQEANSESAVTDGESDSPTILSSILKDDAAEELSRLYGNTSQDPVAENSSHDPEATASGIELNEENTNQPAELNVASTSNEAGEDSYIQEYMKRLLGNGDEAEQPSEPPAAEEKTPSLLEKTFEREIQTRNELLKPSEFVPKSSAPEKSTNLQAMRDLANETARSAIEESSRKKRIEQQSMIALIGAGICFFAGASLAMLSGSMFSLPAIGSVIFFSLTGVGTWYYFEFRDLYSKIGTDEESSQNAEAADNVAKESPNAENSQVENNGDANAGEPTSETEPDSETEK